MRQYAWCGAAAARDPGYREQCARVILARKNLPDRARVDAPGHVVEFLRSGESACGVLVRKGRFWLVVDVHGKEDHVPRDRIIDISSAFIGVDRTHNEMASLLKDMDHERDRLCSEMDLHELWEVVRGEGEREWTLAGLAALYFAEAPGPHEAAALFRALLQGRQFHRHGSCFVPLSARKVRQHDREDRTVAEKTEWLDEAAAWIRGIADGVRVRRPSDADHALDMLADRVLFGNDAPEAEQSAELAKAAHFRSPWAIMDALVKAGRWSPDENLDLLRHRVPTQFDADVLTEAETLCWPATAEKAPVLRIKRVYTFVDGHEGDRLAFSIGRQTGGCVVNVHIALPGLLLRPGGNVQQAASERAAELRLPDRAIPMIPAKTVDGLRFVPGQLRPALTCRARFDDHFQLLNWTFEVRRVRVGHTLRTAAVPDASRSDWGLRKLQALADHLRHARVQAGAIVLPEPGVDVAVRDGDIAIARTGHDSPARLIEEELTVLTNTLAAELCRQERLPAIHRVEDPPSRVVTDAWRFDPVACYQQKRLMPKAVLQVDREPHHGLGVQAYVPMTSPVSRYTDLVMQQQVLSVVTNALASVDEEELGSVLMATAHGRDIARHVEANSRRHWLIRHLESRAGEDLRGMIIDQFASGYLIELDETRLRVVAPVRFGTVLPVGCSVQVRLTKASAREDDVRVAAPVRAG